MLDRNILRIICLSIVVIFVILNESEFSGASAKIPAASEEQRKEIEKIRADLKGAYENHDKKILAEKGVVVQPEWTKKSDQSKIVDTVEVKVTNAGLKEVEKLREEIYEAIKNDAYDSKVIEHSSDHAAILKSVLKEFGGQQRQSHGKVLLGKMLAADDKANVDGHHSVDDDDDVGGPNVVEAAAVIDDEIDIRKLQRLEVSKRRTREMLILKSVEEDFSFDLGDDVQGWAHIMHSGREYFVGRRHTDLVIVQNNGGRYEPSLVLEVGQNITYVETYSFWNIHQQQQEGVLLVASGDKVLWYRGNNETDHIEFYWEWVVGTAISGLTYFTTQNHDYLAVSSMESSRMDHYSLNIYQFDLENSEFWIAQRLQLPHPCPEVTLLDTGRDIILTVPQNNSAAIYTYNPHADSIDHIRFQLRLEVPSEGIESIAAFKMGGRNYLGLGGHQPQILLYQQGEFSPKTILGNNFGLVELFFPIPARTYRDDLILLVQHRVDFGTHTVTVLETLIWNGDSFEASVPVPCQLGQQHTVYGVSCMLDIQRDEGLKGATLLRRGDEIFVIVPRHQAESGLFRLHFEILAKNSELLDLQDIFRFLKDWVKEQDDLVASAQEFLRMPDDPKLIRQPDLSELDTLKAPELIFNGNVGELHINDHKWTDEDAGISADFLTNAIERLGNDLSMGGRHRRDAFAGELSLPTLDVDELEVDELSIENLNSKKFYIQDGSLDFDGIVNLHSLEVLDEATVMVRETRQAVDQTMLDIEGDVEFEEINGIKWSEIADNLIFRTESLELPGLHVEGDVIIEDELSVDVLNSMNFPDDFLWSSGPSGNVVRAEKTFVNTLAANSVDTDGLINGVDPMDAITLSDDQNWKGMPTFAHLEVSEELELNGSAKGPGLHEFPANPTLREAHNISASCHFKHLEVEGPIYLRGKFDQKSLSTLLADLALRPEDPTEEIRIPSKKSFLSSVTFPVDFNVANGKVNDIPIEDFVTLHTNQTLEMPVLEGYVYFKNATITGLYNGVDIKDLAENTLKIDEPTQESLNTQLNFVHDIRAVDVSVRRSLNGVPVNESFQTIDEDLEIDEVEFEHLIANVAHILNNIIAKGERARLNGLNLRTFLTERSWSAPTDTGNIFLNELYLSNDLQTDKLHGIDARYLMKFLEHIDDLPEMILDGKIQVDHIVVTGDVQVCTLNGRQFDEDLQLTAVWLNRPNFLSTDLHFVEPLQIHQSLIVEGAFNGLNLPDIIDDMVFRLPNNSVHIRAPKNFLKDVEVLGSTHLDAVNSVPFRLLASVGSMANFSGSLRINGNLRVNELEITGHLNEFSMNGLSRLVRYDTYRQAFVLAGETFFPDPMHLDDLSVFGDLNDLPRMGEFFESLLLKDSVCILKGRNTFTGRVSIGKGAYVRELNGLNLLRLLENIVFVRDTGPVIINGPVVFTKDVNALSITVEEYLKAAEITGCSLAEWLEESLRVDQPLEVSRFLHFAPGSLDGNSFQAHFLNDLDLSKIITLHTEQNLTDNLLFSTVFLEGKMQVDGPVNNKNLASEYRNTLLTHGDQHVSTPLTMQSLRVLNDLQINVPINGDKDLRQLATLEGPLEFESPLYFQHIVVPHVQTHDFVSGINFEKWFNDSLWLHGRPQQWITGNWSVRRLSVKTGPALPQYMINGMSALDYMRRLPREGKSYEGMCHKVMEYARKQQRRGYFIKHLQRSFVMDLSSSDQANDTRIIVMKNGAERFLLVNGGCTSILYAWNMTAQKFEATANAFETGAVKSALAVGDAFSNRTIVTLTQDSETLNCSSGGGLHVWELSPSNVSHLHKFDYEVIDVNPFVSPQDLNHFLIITADAILRISADDYRPTDHWKLPSNSTADNSNYRFVPNSEALINNGRNIFLLNTTSNSTSSRDKRAPPAVKYSLPLSYHRLKKPSPAVKSLLKPNASAVARRTFEDFKVLVERILVDLIYRLHLEVNITQLSIPEADLYDEHLIGDFLAIMTELRKQQIFPKDMFAKIPLKKLDIPGNPAQILAARTVQIIWPVIVEIEEVHNYLKNNETHEHPVCACIINYLGITVRDVLLLANKPTSAKGSKSSSNNYFKELMAVVERIRKFENHLEAMIEELNAEIKEELTIVDQEIAETEIEPRAISSSPTMNGDSHLIENSNLTASEAIDEILLVPVGVGNNSRSLIAVISPSAQRQMPIDRYDDVRLFTNAFHGNGSGNLFQIISAYKPRCLVHLRIRDETLLAFVEDCCAIRIFIYRGVQGFVSFGKFNTSQPVRQLMGLSLPGASGVERFFLAAVLERHIVFYEFVVAGLKELPNLNCY